MQVVLNDVSHSFGEREVLLDISASFSGPGMLSLMGPSGSGKSTLLAIISGLTRPSRGAIRFSPEQPRIDWVFQTSPLLMKRTALANVELGALARGLSPDDARSRAEEVLRQLDIERLARSRGGDLSGGERQRVAIARGVAADADLLLIDEPTAALDAKSRDVVCTALKQASRRRLVLVATHDSYVSEHSDATFEIEYGQLRKRIQ